MKKLFLLTFALFGLMWAANAQTPVVEFSFDANTKAVTEGTFVSEDGLVTISNLAGSEGSRNVTPYVKGYKVGSVEVDLSSLNGIESATVYMQNGSSGNVMTITTSYFDGIAWVTTETRDVAGNTREVFSPATLVTKANVEKIRFAFSNSSWFCAVKVVGSTVGDGQPAFISGSEIPVADSYIPSSGSITLQFDELIKAGTPGGITLGDATITSVEYKGNTAVINYTGLTAAAGQTLDVPLNAITDLTGDPLLAPFNIQYQIDKECFRR